MVRVRVKVPRDCEVIAHDLSFKSVWRELKKDGWTRKPPPGRSLDDRYFCMPPGKKVKGSEGVDYFRGEQTVLEHYAEELRCRAVGVQPSASGGDQLAAADVVRENYAADIEAAEARARAPTTAQPVPADQATNVVPPVPATSADASLFDKYRNSYGKFTSWRYPAKVSAHPDATTRSRCHYSSEEADGSDNISDGDSTHPAGTPTRNDDADEDGEDSALGSELLADSIDDLNVVGNHAIEHLFGKLDSEADDMETGECVSDEEVKIYCAADAIGDDPVATEDEITAEVLFADNFLNSFGGEDEVLAGNLKNAVLCEMSAKGWEDIDEPDTTEYMHGPYDPVNNTSSYPGLRQGYSGPSADALRRGDSPIGLFFYYLPVVLW
ncbi:hypothetical protein L917_14678 [Phytophthora nicotianae]|uniref:Uncharacterized protein n=1 Tax=Phytophthora nicotianae TaxID=4792 RepID=W2KN94_PHYNI|nr:hypothetical protein L917_14678 [Phytophthora nicotianae]